MLKEILEHIQYVLDSVFNPEKEYNIEVNLLTKKDYNMYIKAKYYIHHGEYNEVEIHFSNGEVVILENAFPKKYLDKIVLR